MHIIAAKAVCFLEAMKPEFKDYQRQIVKNAQALADALTAHGFRIVSGGTDNHLMLVDLRPKKLTGKIAQEALDRAGVTLAVTDRSAAASPSADETGSEV